MAKPLHIKQHYIEYISQLDFLLPEAKQKYIDIIEKQPIPDNETTRDMVLAKLFWICEKNLPQSRNDHNKKLLDQFAANVGIENLPPRKTFRQSGNN